MKCEYCYKELSSSGYQEHIRRFHILNDNRTCKICSKSFTRHIAFHILKKHNLKSREYYDQYIKKDIEGKCEVCGSDTRFIDIVVGYALFCSTKCVSASTRLKFKRQATSVKNYGTSNYSKSIEGLIFHRNKRIKEIEIQRCNGEPLVPTIGKNERICLNVLEKEINYKILRNIKRFGCFPDGFIDKFNLVIEYDEPHHRLSKSYDKRREMIFESNGLVIYRIKEEDWLFNKNEVIQKFKFFLKGIEND